MSHSTLPLFPLPSVVLFPNVFLPLHIFETRYRQLVDDVLAGDRLIGMTLLRPGAADFDDRPPIYATGCSGLITHAERLADGRFNLILRGVDKFTVERETPPEPGQLYRRAIVSLVDERVTPPVREALAEQRRKIEALLTPLFDGSPVDHHLPGSMPDEDVVNSLAQYLEFDPIEKQALLERPGPLARSRSMVELLEMKALIRQNTGERGKIH